MQLSDGTGTGTGIKTPDSGAIAMVPVLDFAGCRNAERGRDKSSENVRTGKAVIISNVPERLRVKMMFKIAFHALTRRATSQECQLLHFSKSLHNP